MAVLAMSHDFLASPADLIVALRVGDEPTVVRWLGDVTGEEASLASLGNPDTRSVHPE
jgi:cell division inhibitor SulA